MANMLHGFGPVAEGGPNVHQFYRDDIGFGHIEEVKLRKPVYEGMGSFALKIVFYDANRPHAREFPSGAGFMRADDIIGQDNGTEALVDRAVKIASTDPGFKFI